jgi:hypothetical protein
LSPPPILSWARQARELNGTLFSSHPNLVDAAAHGHTMRSLILTRWLASQANSSPSRRWEGDLVGNATTDCHAHDKRSDRLDLRAAHLPSHSSVMALWSGLYIIPLRVGPTGSNPPFAEKSHTCFASHIQPQTHIQLRAYKIRQSSVASMLTTNQSMEYYLRTGLTTLHRYHHPPHGTGWPLIFESGGPLSRPHPTGGMGYVPTN